MKPELVYNGKKLTWEGQGVFKATSGMEDAQFSIFQCTPDKGPIPHGEYYLSLKTTGQAKDNGKDTCNLSPSSGVQTIPRGSTAGACEEFWINWGNNRVRLEPANKTTKNICTIMGYKTNRGGFYLHDSTKGYSHGCIEIESLFFSKLRAFIKTKKKIKEKTYLTSCLSMAFFYQYIW